MRIWLWAGRRKTNTHLVRDHAHSINERMQAVFMQKENAIAKCFSVGYCLITFEGIHSTVLDKQ